MATQSADSDTDKKLTALQLTELQLFLADLSGMSKLVFRIPNQVWKYKMLGYLERGGWLGDTQILVLEPPTANTPLDFAGTDKKTHDLTVKIITSKEFATSFATFGTNLTVLGLPVDAIIGMINAELVFPNLHTLAFHFHALLELSTTPPNPVFGQSLSAPVLKRVGVAACPIEGRIPADEKLGQAMVTWACDFSGLPQILAFGINVLENHKLDILWFENVQAKDEANLVTQGIPQLIKATREIRYRVVGQTYARCIFE